MAERKRCTKCRKWRALSQFDVDDRYLCGRRPICKICRNERMRTRAQERTRERKHAVILKYGGKCTCCGESQIEFLCIDHVHEDGSKNRKASGGVYGVYRWLLNNPVSNRYRVLCHNCNHAEYFEVDGCPHRRLQ